MTELLVGIVVWAVWFVFNLPGMLLMWIAYRRDDSFMQGVSIPFLDESIGNLKGWLVTLMSLCVWSALGFVAYAVTLAIRHF
jgi:hypothetical protein